jgi:hypothetical protein
VVKAGERGLTFDEKDVQYSRGGGAVELMFIIGTPKLSDLGSLFNPDTLKDTTIVNIDNKAENQGFGELVVVSPNASSISEMIAELIVELGYQLDVDISQNLLSGILDATQNFQDSRTSSLAFEMSGLLMKNGAVRMPARAARQEDRDAFAPFVQQQAGRMPQPFPQVRPGKVPTRQFPTRQFAGVTDDRQMPPPDRADQQDRQTEQKQPADQKPPADWLTPKVYKGSSEI